MHIEKANLAIGSCRELVDNLLIFIHANQAGLREDFGWRSAGNVTDLGPLWREKYGDHFFHQENKNADNAQDDGDSTHSDDGLSNPIEDAASFHTS